MNLTSKQGYIYIKNNGLNDPTIHTRVFGAYNSGKIRVSGRYLARTWSLLADKAIYGMNSISLLHKPEDMVSVELLSVFIIYSKHVLYFRAGELVIELL